METAIWGSRVRGVGFNHTAPITLCVQIPKKWVLGFGVFVTVVGASGRYMIMRYLNSDCHRNIAPLASLLMEASIFQGKTLTPEDAASEGILDNREKACMLATWG